MKGSPPTRSRTLWERLVAWADETSGWSAHLSVFPEDGPDFGKVEATIGPVTGLGETTNEAINELADGLMEEGWQDDRLPVMALRRHPDGTMDDVVVEDVETFRAEQMSEGELWMACYFRNGERVTFNVHANRKNDLSYDVGEMPAKWIDWDKRP